MVKHTTADIKKTALAPVRPAPRNIRSPKQEAYSFINALVEPVWIYNLKGIIIKSNASAVKALGFSPIGINRAALIKKIGLRLSNGKKAALGHLPSTAAFKGNAAGGRQFFFRDTLGRERAVIISAAPLRVHGKIISVMVVWHDITRRVKAEKVLQDSHRHLESEVRKQTAVLKATNRALQREIRQRVASQELVQRSYEFLEKIFSTTTFLIAYMDTQGTILRVNNAFARSEGQPPEFFVGKKLFELFPSDEHKNILFEALKAGEPLAIYEKEFRFVNHPERGVTFWDCNLLPIKNAGGAIEGIIMCLVDRTKSRQARQELHNKEKELADAKRLSEIGRLAAIVAHELRNPLGVIRTAAFNIRQKAKNPRIDNNLANIEKKILESEQIISNLLSYSRVKIPRFEVVRIEPLLHECIDAMRERFRKRPMTVAKQTLAIKGDAVWADPVQLREVFNNILVNAYDACCDTQGSLVVTGKKQGSENIVITFQDNGIGITDEQMKRIFEPFFTTKTKGTGLGLAICKQLIELHRGFLAIESKWEQGTCITVTLPIRRDQIEKLGDAHHIFF